MPAVTEDGEMVRSYRLRQESQGKRKEDRTVQTAEVAVLDP